MYLANKKMYFKLITFLYHIYNKRKCGYSTYCRNPVSDLHFLIIVVCERRRKKIFCSVILE